MTRQHVYDYLRRYYMARTKIASPELIQLRFKEIEDAEIVYGYRDFIYVYLAEKRAKENVGAV